MNYLEKAKISLDEALTLLRTKPHKSTLVERYFLLYEAWENVKGLPQPIQMGEGLFEVLSKASLPIKNYDILLGRFDDHLPTPEEEARLQELWRTAPTGNPIVGHNVGHIVLDFEDLVKQGIPAYIENTRNRLKEAEDNCEGENALNYLKGRLRIYEAILNYIKRYEKAAAEAGLYTCAEVCKSLCNNAPKTFREAMQLILFVYNIYLIYAGTVVACLTVGRLDDFLLPLYLKDIENNLLDEETAGCIIDDFSAKMSLHLGRGEHQMAYLDEDYEQTGWLRNPVYESPGYITLGGYSNYIDHKKNPLSILFAKHINPGLKNPIYVCRHTKESFPELWDILYEKVQQNASLLLYNDETVIPAYKNIGVTTEDAINYSVHPCNWASLAGCMTPWKNPHNETLPAVINKVLHSGVFENIDELLEAIFQAYGELLIEPFEEYRKEFKNIKPSGILSMTDCFQRGTLESANRVSQYPTTFVFIRNIGTACDMLSAVNSIVFQNKECTYSELLSAADNNFEGYEYIRKLCLNAPKYGTDNDLADELAVKLTKGILDVIDKAATNSEGVRDVYTLNVTINDSNHLANGKEMGATVDGRLKGQPLSENLGPTVGYSKGITPLLNSVAKLPFDRIHSGTLNIRLRKNEVSNEKGFMVLKALIESYFKMGGMQVQVSIANTEDLKKAKEDPDSYRDLLVRITGYSAIFVDMTHSAQDEFIRREELS